jgi:type III restriction enzyme
MELKNYQVLALAQVQRFLETLEVQEAKGNRHPSLDSWNDLRYDLTLHGSCKERQNGLGKDLPTICIKVPTGGGKTLLATQILGLIHSTILRKRNGAGLVLWVVPSDQIYKDTLRALRDRRHFYRESLEHALSRRLEVWEKTDIARLTPGQLASNLNLLIVKLPGTNRQDRESLKFFRDSGGNIVQHFPAEDDSDANRALKKRVPNLDMLVDEPSPGNCLAKTSLANLVRLCEPAVILDEGHKATSKLARETIEGFNPSIVVELSATPHEDANVLVRVTGQALLDEQMIKLPVNVANSSVSSWQDCLTQAKDKRESLAKLAEEHYRSTGRLIRPIVLVQVERTGKDQREAGLVHSEDIKEHLVSRLNVAATAIAIKSSEKDDIEGIDLLDEGCPIEWIITKAALQEGWDCPFAYILVSLSNTASQQSMTQLVGRVLRQPEVTKTAFQELNESYVFCRRQRAADVTNEVKKALENEGYEGDLAAVVDRSGDGALPPALRQRSILPKFAEHYTKPFEGKIYLPLFCVKNGAREYERLDYYRHLLSRVNVDDFGYQEIDWDLSADLAGGRDYFYRITLNQQFAERTGDQEPVNLETDNAIKAWLAANLGFDYFSQKEMRLVVDRVADRLFKVNKHLADNLGLVKFVVRDKIVDFIKRETDGQTEAAFKKLFNAKKLCFYLQCVECRFEIPSSVEVRAITRLNRNNGDSLERSLFDYVGDDLNEYEKSVALFLDEHQQVLWWYRNLVGPDNFSIQGFRRNPLYPDFVVQGGADSKPIPWVVLLESKGKHLKGSEDTNYKRNMADYFEKVGRKVKWQELGREFEDHRFRFQVLDEGEYADRNWREDLKHLLDSATED